ncbi:MAG: nitrous oxide reductase accessory protein NosL [Sphingomonadales bacterium]|nr:nitrous oxide reductase accessory protein NosL [Sphingomonadales bacterium]
MRWIGLVLLLTVLTAGCDARQAEAPPPPQEPTREALGYFCGMIVVDHQGPKGQVHLKGREEPIWFTSVRDAIAFTMLPEESKAIAAIYVTDVGRADWDAPEPGTWTDARTAYYVIGSGRIGGMGAPEAVPFAARAAAEALAAAEGGSVVAFGDIPADAILGDDGEPQEESHDGHH